MYSYFMETEGALFILCHPISFCFSSNRPLSRLADNFSAGLTQIAA